MNQPRATVIGLGLIGGSVGLALRQVGWHVSGHDERAEAVDAALVRQVIDAAGIDPASEVTIVAVPVTAAAPVVERALAETAGVVTDVGSVKGPIARTVTDPRFVPGHPMAGSERLGLDGADASMFSGAVWVLTPSGTTNDTAFAQIAALVRSLGAEVITLPADQHDALVAIVSHVPHLTAATLMQVADSRADDHAALLRLAAGGFRDMTRIASGHPAIWPDICAENRTAILDGLDALIDGLRDMRDLVDRGDGAAMTSQLERARRARSNLPVRASRPEHLVEIRVPIPDRPGALAEIATLAAELGVNLDAFEVVHSAEGDKGTAILLIDAERRDLYRGGLIARGYRPGVQPLE